VFWGGDSREVCGDIVEECLHEQLESRREKWFGDGLLLQQLTHLSFEKLTSE